MSHKHPTYDDNGSHSVKEPYVASAQYHSQPSYLRVICAGAGAAGILLAYRMQKSFQNFDLVELGKEQGMIVYSDEILTASIGMRTGIRAVRATCEPAHNYTYPFEPNPERSSFYAYHDEILKYFENFVDKYNLDRFIRLRSKVVSAVWSEEKGVYDIEIETPDGIVKDWGHTFVNGCGFLNDWKWPDIEGLDSFEGTLLHTANWDPAANYDGKTVAVIGNGSSGIQVIPEVQKTAKKVIAFMRSPTWVFPSIAEDLLKEENEEASQEIMERSREQAQHFYTEEEKATFRNDPDEFLAYRKRIEASMNDNYPMFLKDDPAVEKAREFLTEKMHRRIGPEHEDLKKILIPSWTPGCRRVTPGPGYLEALTKPNVRTVIRGVDRCGKDGLVDDAGEFHKVDMIICATGFKIAFAPPFLVRGVDGVNMADEFKVEPKVYLAMTVPKFPNYFVVNGVRGNWAVGSVLASVRRVSMTVKSTFEVRPEPIDDLYEHIDEFHSRSIWSDDCSSWYKGGVKNGKVWIWGGSGLHYMRTIRMVRWEDYKYRYHRRNVWSFLGNGWTGAQVKRDRANVSPYIRNSDTPWEFDELGSKKTQEELRQQFMDLVNKEDCSLLHRLVAENDQLLKVHEHCQSKIEGLVHWSQDCLEFTQNPSLSFKATCSRDGGSSHSAASGPAVQKLPADPTLLTNDDGDLDNIEPSSNNPATRPQPSIISQISSALRKQQVSLKPDCSSSDLIESVIMWKIANAESLGSESLIAHLGLDDAPIHMNMSKVRSAICWPSFYESLHRALYHNEPIPHASPGDIALDNLNAMPTLVKERRSIYYLSFVHLQQYRASFPGLPEYFAAYWITYTYVTFLTFPTETNLKKCPMWLRPTHGQFENDHPGNIDFYVWPMVREELTRAWPKHDIRRLTHSVVQNMVLLEFPGKLGSTQIMLKPDLSDLELTPTFHQGILDLQNYRIKETFRQRYPELFELFRMPDLHCPETQDRPNESVSEDDLSGDMDAGLARWNLDMPTSAFMLDDDMQDPSAIFNMTEIGTDFSLRFLDFYDPSVGDRAWDEFYHSLVP
ncbi:hypothetical protein BHE90_013841 [Fusarium euwallaceae]|uniref:FAD/NAD(P)-binding domain-containing protein n=1 Tax=Fusarium euwallaceae TaxID=1147111 RepID=A0A430L7W3_9HYPO|nr:hypothetical protein BHE90_013841 [Fusarium euwallaceae]